MEQLVTIAALDKYITTFWLLFADGGFHLLYIMELTEVTGDICKVITHQPHFLKA